MKRINVLDKHIINQIAAGEVIERPASVVKELVENSIDAGAKKVEILITNDCRDIRIADNGSGIHPDDIELAFVKHATSKINNDSDLYDISSFGFRGEALASIISISKLTAITRVEGYDYGFKVECANSQANKTQTGCAVGTVMDVKDLFYNLPVRLKFLKTASTEFGYISEIVQSIALANPDVAVVLKNNGVESLKTSGSANLKTTICEVFSNSFVDKLIEVQKDDLLSHFSVSGYCAAPDYTRSSKKSIITFINNRVVKCHVLSKAIETAYRSKLPNGRYPFVVLNLTVPTSEVDVNVHPQKKEVRYKNTNQIFQFVMSAVEYALNSQKTDYDNFAPSKVVDIFASKNAQNYNDDAVYVGDVSVEEVRNSQFALMDKIVAETEQKSFGLAQNISQTKDYRVIGQYKNTYILLETQDGLSIVDQHIAQERYFFEKLQNEQVVTSQILLISDIIKVDGEEAELIKSNVQLLEKMGYLINFVSENEISFRKVPQVVSHISVNELFEDIIKTLRDKSKRNIQENMLTSISCKASVKAGDELTLWQMEEIIKLWKTTKNPQTCPHGRPIEKKFSHNEIANCFLRNE